MAMSDSSIRIEQDEITGREEDRFDRFRLIGWWDQQRLGRAKALVVGAGALGNEIIKNLALLGWGNLLIVDKDRIENSNLSRSVLYRENDTGQSKAEVAARAARGIYPGINVRHVDGDVVHDVGLGLYRWADVVFGGLDNREARLAINRCCGKLNRPWIDGAIEQIQGCARVFVPGGPCYECTMSELDWRLLERRRSCNLLTRSEMEAGKTPTTPTISSIIAGVQCQEGVKLIHGLDTIRGKGWVFEGLSGDSYLVEYQRKADCYSHDPLGEVISLPSGSSTMTVAEMLDEVRRTLGGNVELELSRDLLEKLVCPRCGREESCFTSLGRVGLEQAYCPSCGDSRREAVTFHRIRGSESFLDRTVREIGIPPFDIVIARSATRAVGFEFSSDAAEVLGPLLGQGDAIEWT
jgi:adenylyltransferase/sulfurtransferase